MALIRKLDQFNCFVQVIDGKLHRCNISKTGEVQASMAGMVWEPVTRPVDPYFLECANQILGTSFSETALPMVGAKKK